MSDAFRSAVRDHYANVPGASTVKREGDHVYSVTLASGHRWITRRTRRAAEREAGPEGDYARGWRSKERWYSGERDGRSRELTSAERAIIAEERERALNEAASDLRLTGVGRDENHPVAARYREVSGR